MPAQPIREALSETVPTGFSPGKIDEKDFRIEWTATPPSGLEAEFVSGSTEWSRVTYSLLIPRVRLRLKSNDPKPILIQVDSVQTILPARAQGVEGEVLIPLTGNNEVTLLIGDTRHAFRLIYAPRDQRSKIFIDHTCSPFQLRSGIQKAQSPFWVWIGCRSVHSKGDDRRRQIVELYVLTDAGDSPLRQGSTELRPVVPGITTLRLDPARQTYAFHAKNGSFSISESAAPDVPYGFVGVGAGPYHYTFQAGDTNVRKTVPVTTLYGSYALTDGIRLTAFNATAIHRNFLSDSGVYFNSESFRALDRRISFHVMLGMNAVAVRLGDSKRIKLGAPQGIEATWRDFIWRNYSLNGGAFLYPKINNTAYYNLWFRYGSRGYFFEVNYLNIRNEIKNTPVFSKTLGLSIGAPLVRFF